MNISKATRIKRLKRPKRPGLETPGLIYLSITKSPGLFAPTAENPAMNYE
jgi:hypothetical protein